MPRSTASFISYDLRPAKQSERRILIELLKLGGDAGLPLPSYRYVGMGANRFYDFLLIHKYVGLTNMISLEHDPDMHKRALYNLPFYFIDARYQTVADFLASDTAQEPTIYWFDYDGGVGGHIVQNINDLALNAKPGDFGFVTVFGGPPRRLSQMNSAARLAWLQDNLGAVAGGVTLSDVTNSNFPDAVHKVLMAAFTNAFASRRDGTFYPFLQVEYTDTSTMITVGGAFMTTGQWSSYESKLRVAMPFLGPHGLYEIASLHLTDRERRLFDRAVTAPSRKRADRNELVGLGFQDSHLQAYRELLRYLPRYVETMI
jgi:hypothetical protein